MTPPIDPRTTLNSVLRTDFPSFLHKSFLQLNPGETFQDNWHLKAIAWHLERVRRGEIKRLLITMPPRSLKSLSVSVAFPAFLLGHDPTLRVVTASYAEDLSLKLARDCRSLMQARWYKDVFPKTRLRRGRTAENDFETTQHGGRLSTTTGGALTGRGGDIIIVDDPMKASDAQSDARRHGVTEWFQGTLLSRLNDKRTGAIIVVMQRLHVDDLAGKLIATGDWTHLNLPAIAPGEEMVEVGENRFHRRAAGEALHPSREPLDVLDQLRREMGSHDFSAQYLQEPVPAAGNLIKREWFGYYDVAPERELPGQLIQSWDFAVSDGDGADYTVAITAWVRGQQICILDVFRARIDYPEQKRKFIELARHWKPDLIIVEKAANGAPLLSDLRQLNLPGVRTPVGITPKGSKIERLSVNSSRIEAGDVLLPRSARWLDEFITEVIAFPKGMHDDQVDALSQLLTRTANNPEVVHEVNLPPDFGPKLIVGDSLEKIYGRRGYY